MTKKRPNVAVKSSEFTFSYFWDFGYIGSYVVYHKQNISHRLYPSTAIPKMVVGLTQRYVHTYVWPTYFYFSFRAREIFRARETF